MKFNDDFLFDNLGKLIILGLALCFLALYLCIRYENKVTYPKAYEAWLKMSGQTNVSYEEWLAYVKATKPQSTTTVVPVYIHR